MNRREKVLCWCGRPDHPMGACPVCGRPLDHHEDRVVSEVEWRGRARMAHARIAAGLPLDDVDRQALVRHPECPPLLEVAS